DAEQASLDRASRNWRLFPLSRLLGLVLWDCFSSEISIILQLGVLG
ncbi:17174_t:CDS:1, partial [Gigaspora rosea]